MGPELDPFDGDEKLTAEEHRRLLEDPEINSDKLTANDQADLDALVEEGFVDPLEGDDAVSPGEAAAVREEFRRMGVIGGSAVSEATDGPWIELEEE